MSNEPALLHLLLLNLLYLSQNELEVSELLRHVLLDHMLFAKKLNIWQHMVSTPSRVIQLQKVTACCSAIPTSKVLEETLFINLSSPVPEGMAAVIAQIFLSFFAKCIKVSENTEVKVFIRKLLYFVCLSEC